MTTPLFTPRCFNSSPPGLNGHNFSDDILNTNVKCQSISGSSARVVQWFLKGIKESIESVRIDSWRKRPSCKDTLNSRSGCFNLLRPRQNGPHFATDIFKRIFVNEMFLLSCKMSLKHDPCGLIDNKPLLIQIMAWHRNRRQASLWPNYTPAQRSWRGGGGILDSPCPSVRLSVCLSVDDMVSGA